MSLDENVRILLNIMCKMRQETNIVYTISSSLHGHNSSTSAIISSDDHVDNNCMYKHGVIPLAYPLTGRPCCT